MDHKTDKLDPRFLTLAAAAVYCGLSRDALRRLTLSGKLKAYSPGGRLLIEKTELDAVILGSRKEPATTAAN